MSFSDRLAKLRNDKKISQAALARKLGTARTTYSGYERGTSEPDFKNLVFLADFFEVTIDYLVGRSDHPKMWFKGEDEKTIYDLTKLSDEEIERIPLAYDGFELNNEEKREFIAIAKGIFDVRKSLKQNR